IANRGSGYTSIHDVWLRSGLDKADITRLADADAFGSLGLRRREALWAVQGLDKGKVRDRLPLLDAPDNADLRPEPELDLPQMLPGEEVIEDYRYLKLSLKGHPVAFLRNDFKRMGITRSVDL